MIKLPPNLSPSTLLCMDDVSLFVSRLLQRCRASRLEARWETAEQSARDALEGSHGTSTQIGRAAALIHLADVHRGVGKMGIALREAKSAYRIFSAQSSRLQRHNEAVAAYALGLAHHSLAARLQALKWYEESSRLLDRVKIDWCARKAEQRVTCCKDLQRWLEALGNFLMAPNTSPASRGQSTIWLPFVVSDTETGSGPRFTLAPLEVEQYILATTLELRGHTFRIEPLDRSSGLRFRPDVDYFGLRIPEEALALLDADEGDYAVIVRQGEADQEGLGVIEADGHMYFGKFEYDESGRIKFLPTDGTILGGGTIKTKPPVGYVTALLRRT